MEISSKQQGTATVIAIKGSIDGITAAAITEYLSKQVSLGNAKLVADMTEVDYVSSAGLRVLLGAAKESRRNDGDLRLAAAEHNILEILQMAGFLTILKHYETVSDAIVSFE